MVESVARKYVIIVSGDYCRYIETKTKRWMMDLLGSIMGSMDSTLPQANNKMDDETKKKVQGIQFLTMAQQEGGFFSTKRRLPRIH